MKKDDLTLLWRRIRPSRFLPLSRFIKRSTMTRWGFQPLRFVLVWIGGFKFRPYLIKREWTDRLSCYRLQRRGYIIGPLFIGLEGNPILTLSNRGIL